MRTTTTFLLLIMISLISSSLMAQNPGEKVFDNAVLHEVRINFEESNYWSRLINNFDNTPMGGKVPYMMADISYDGELVDSVGIRLKGFTSYWTESNKKPIKIDFNEFVKGKRLDGLKKLNLNNGTGDPALQRDVVCYDLLRRVGVGAPKTAYAKVYLNDTYWGLYQVIQQIDKTFLSENFSEPKGNLFKNKAWSTFEWFGTNKEDYKQIFELKTNEEGDNWDGFIDLMDLLNNGNDTEFKNEIEGKFNVSLFLKNLAVDIATNNWDSYMEHGRNWYMYEDTTTGQFHWVPWDYNLALNGTLGGGGGGCDLFPDLAAGTDGSKTVHFYKSGFAFGEVTYFWDFGDGNSSTQQDPVHVYDQEGDYQVCLTFTQDEECEETYCERISTSYDYNECPVVVNGTFTEEVDKFFVLAIDWDPSCCDIWGFDCDDLRNFFIEQEGGDRDNGFSVDLKDNKKLLIQRLWEIPTYKQTYYDHFCRMMREDFNVEYYNSFIDTNVDLIRSAVEEDQNALYTFNKFEEDAGTGGLKLYLEQRIESLNNQLIALDVCAEPVAVANGDLVINEFVASNDSTSTITDDNGDFDDWIELFNPSANEIDLSNVYISDNKDNLKKFNFPTGSRIKSGEYIIVWADKDEEQSGYHADFKLSKGGESIILSNADESIIDSLRFTEQETNIASARIPNGRGEFVSKESTFGFNNAWTTGHPELPSVSVKIFPNPSSELLTIDLIDGESLWHEIKIISLDGRVLSSQKFNTQQVQLPVKDLVKGMYFLEVIDAKGQSTSVKFIKA